MQDDPQSSPAFSRRWTVAAIAAATVAIAGAALSWHGHAHAFGPGHHGPAGREQVDPEMMREPGCDLQRQRRGLAAALDRR